MKINLDTSITHTANDDAKTLMCESGCGRPACSKDHMLCVTCAQEMNDHIDEPRFYIGDPEGENNLAGIDTDPRY